MKRQGIENGGAQGTESDAWKMHIPRGHCLRVSMNAFRFGTRAESRCIAHLFVSFVCFACLVPSFSVPSSRPTEMVQPIISTSSGKRKGGKEGGGFLL